MEDLTKRNIFNLTLEEFKIFFKKIGYKEFRAKQVFEWIWKKGARKFEEMTNLSKEIRKILDASFYIPAIKIESLQQSKDGTFKFAFRLYDNLLIEGVLIPTKDRITACISSQVGCPLNCKFCATTKLGWKRNLEFYEVYDQIILLNNWAEKSFKKPLSNIVLMGMGEPLLNYENIKKAIKITTSSEGMAMSPSRITLSTVGITNGIIQMANDKAKYNLAISLHTANNNKRDKIIPANKKHPLDQLKEAIKTFYQATGTRITFEYILLKNINNSLQDAEELANFCKIVPCKINLIEYNEVKYLHFKKSSTQQTQNFIKYLEKKNLIVNLRKSRGIDIDAACGQLANKL